MDLPFTLVDTRPAVPHRGGRPLDALTVAVLNTATTGQAVRIDAVLEDEVFTRLRARLEFAARRRELRARIVREPKAVLAWVEPRAQKPAPASEAPSAERAASSRAQASSAPASNHTEGILSALKSEQAAYGLTLADVCRALVGPGKPSKAAAINGAVHQVLGTLIRQGQVRKDGRHYYIVRAHDREAGVQ